MDRRPGILFISYAPEDNVWREQLEKQLAPLVISGRIAIRSPVDVPPGAESEQVLSGFVGEATMVVSLISATYIASSDVRRQQIEAILRERASRPSLRVVPVLVKACLFAEEPWLKPLQMLPRDKTPIARGSRAAEKEEALRVVASEIAEMLAEDESQRSREFLAARQF